MNMKKMLSLALAGVMALSLMACSAQNGGDSSENTSSPSSSQSSEETQNNETPESVTITSLNANKEAAELEVPYDPCILFRNNIGLRETKHSHIIYRIYV